MVSGEGDCPEVMVNYRFGVGLGKCMLSRNSGLSYEKAKPTGTGQEGSMRIAIFVLAVGAILGAALARTGAAVHQSGNSTVGLAASGTEFKPGQALRDCSDCPEMIAIPAGSFLMGAPANELGRFQEEGPQRQVGIRQFAAGAFDVTRAEWAKFVADTKRAGLFHEFLFWAADGWFRLRDCGAAKDYR